jgi:hypothetical protein
MPAGRIRKVYSNGIESLDFVNARPLRRDAINPGSFDGAAAALSMQLRGPDLQ